MGSVELEPFDDEPCEHDCDEECAEYGCRHSHCWACGGCTCAGYCDDHQTYNLRPGETGGIDGP
jgi:hypothetical protein